MQIEQFDTGLKGQEKVEKLVITPNENYKYKQLVRGYLSKIVNEGISKLDENLENAFSKLSLILEIPFLNICFKYPLTSSLFLKFSSGEIINFFTFSCPLRPVSNCSICIYN